MNKIFNHISWGTYLETCALIAILYYVYIGWKYYKKEISIIIQRLTGKKDEPNQLPEALQYQAEENSPVEIISSTVSAGHVSYEQTFNGPTQILANCLTACIDQAADEPYTPDALIIQLKKILNDHPDVAATPDRETINALVAGECEKTGTALLSESEVDTWWSA